MSYTVNIKVYQQSTQKWHTIVEKAVWNYANGGTWSESNGLQVLKMGGSGTAGTLRFVSETGDAFMVVIGVHNYKPWVDVADNLKTNQTCVSLLPEYYKSGTDQTKTRESQLTLLEKTDAKNTAITAAITKEDGKEYFVDIVIA